MEPDVLPLLSIGIAMLTLLSCLSSAFLAVYSFTRDPFPGKREFSLICVSAAVWAGFATAEYLSLDPTARTIFGQLTYAGSAWITLLWLFFVLRFTHKDRYLTPWVTRLAFLLPASSVVLALTTQYHGLVWASVEYLATPYPDLYIERGPWFNFVMTPLHYGFILVGILLLMSAYVQSESREYRGQILWLICSVAAIMVVSMLHVLSGVSLYGLDPTPVTLLVAPLLVSVAINRNRFMQRPEISYRSVFMDARDPVVLVDSQGRVMDLNPAARAMCSIESPLRASVRDAFPDCSEALISASGRELVEEARQGGKQIEFRSRELRDTRGVLIGRQLTMRALAATPDALATTYVDRDPLTGLIGRKAFFTRLDAAIESAQFFTLVFADLNEFRELNSALGHNAGDQVLIETARRMLDVVDNRGVTARVGGDEFVILLPSASREVGLRICERLEKQLSPEFILAGQATKISASIGLACYPDDGQDSATLMGNVDKRMYWIKRRRLRSNAN